jgi:hypothetical protein
LLSLSRSDFGRSPEVCRTGFATRVAESLPEEPRCEVVEAAPPRKPFVRRAGRLEIHIVNAGRGQSVAELLRSRPFDGPDSEEKDFDLFVECG